MAVANTTKTSWRLHDFVAHSCNVSCLALGKSSGRLLATGGKDCRVNIWGVDRPNCIMSLLTGHSNPVECIQFNSSEELVVAGFQSGSLRVWDLEAAKTQRSLSGHKANITSLDFHPSGDFLASGSMDTNIKVWDVRRKGNIFSYKSHSQAVRYLAFSPDGKRLASASDDCTIKLFDLTAGKIMTEFTGHTAAVNVVQFHPNECLLASGSSDRTIKLWDLDTFRMIGSSDGESGPVRCVTFSPDGCCVYTGAVDALRVYGWEPVRRFDVVPVCWGKVADLAVCNDKLVGLSYHLTNVSSYVVDLTRVKKSGGSAIPGGIQDDRTLAEPSPKGSSLPRRSYERPATARSDQRVKQSSDADRRSPSSEEEREENESNAEIRIPEDYDEIFQPKNALSHSPPGMTEPFPGPQEEETFVATASQKDAVSDKLQTSLSENQPIAMSTPIPRVEHAVVSSAPRPIPTAVTHSTVRPSDRPPAQANAWWYNWDNSPPDSCPSVLGDEEALSQIKKGHDTMLVMLTTRRKNLEADRAVWGSEDIKTSLSENQPIAMSTPIPRVEHAVVSSAPRPIPTAVTHSTVRPPDRPPAQANAATAGAWSNVIPSTRDEPIGLDVADSLLNSPDSCPSVLEDEEALSQIKKSHDTMRVMLTSRHKNLEAVRAVWGSEDVKNSLDTAIAMDDPSIVVDILNIVDLKPSLWKLDLCTSILPQIEELLQSKYESYVQTGCMALKRILKRFGPLISDTLTARQTVGVDIARDDRQQKCMAYYEQLKNLSDVVKNKADQVGRHASAFEELQLLLATLDYSGH